MTKINSSRLKRNIKKNNKKTIFISLAGLLLFFIGGIMGFPYIIEGIGNVAGVLNKDNPSKSIETKNDELLIPPTLTNTPNATTSARIKVYGNAEQDGTIEIYVNDQLEDEIESEKGDEFESSLLKLRDGNNQIRTKIRTVDSESDLSEIYEVTLISKDPTLDISYPQDGAKLVKADKRITIQGKTDEDNSVTVNGTRAIVEFDGSFSHLIELNEGDNHITITAQNLAGKNIEKKLTVSYSRE